MQNEETMWKWLLHETEKLVNSTHITNSLYDKNDLVQEIMMRLVRYNDKAVQIYQNNQIGLLRDIINKKLFEVNIQTCPSAYLDVRKKTIEKKCRELGIEPIPQNAYKISPFMLQSNKIYSISYIEQLLSDEAVPEIISFEHLSEVSSVETQIIRKF